MALSAVAGLKAWSPRAASSPCWQQLLAGCTALTVCTSTLQSSPACRAQLILHLCKTGAAVLRAMGRIGNETVEGSLNERPEGWVSWYCV